MPRGLRGRRCCQRLEHMHIRVVGSNRKSVAGSDDSRFNIHHHCLMLGKEVSSGSRQCRPGTDGTPTCWEAYSRAIEEENNIKAQALHTTTTDNLSRATQASSRLPAQTTLYT